MSQQQRAPVKLNSVLDASRYMPNTAQSSLIVAVRVRPILKSEHAKAAKGNGAEKRDIIKVMDERVVLVLDPDDTKDYLDQVQNRTKEKRYTFDIAFGAKATNMDVYNGTVRELVSGVLHGINTTVFAYGATGSGKTYTMVGSHDDPGLMVLSLEKIFDDRDKLYADEEFSVTCSYMEVYNELLYDLLVKNSGPLELREDADQGVQVAGLKHVTVTTAGEILDLLDDGNKRRKTESTDANSQSSRSHAVLEIAVSRKPKNHYRVQQLSAKLCLVDLAGSERAAETNNGGQKLRDGANINRSLLALANCINALGKRNGKEGGASYVPYRNSKLTRLLKDGLSGNSRTAMITTVSTSSDQYHHSINTLKYADRAKEIKTHIVQNVGTVESHVSDYQRIIDNLQNEVQGLKSQLAEAEAAPPVVAGSVRVRSTEEDILAMVNKMVAQMNENIEERINLQKGIFEIEDANSYNRAELKQLDEFLNAGHGHVKDVVESRDRRREVLSAIKENDKELERYKADVAANEVTRQDIQSRVDDLVSSGNNAQFQNLMSTFRLQAVRLQEIKFQLAVRDQIIVEQREVIGNLWKIIDKSGMGKDTIQEIARQEGIQMDGFFKDDKDNMLQGPPTVGAGAFVDLVRGGQGAAIHANGNGHAVEAAGAQGGVPRAMSKSRLNFLSKLAGSDAGEVLDSGASEDDTGDIGSTPRSHSGVSRRPLAGAKDAVGDQRLANRRANQQPVRFPALEDAAADAIARRRRQGANTSSAPGSHSKASNNATAPPAIPSGRRAGQLRRVSGAPRRASEEHLGARLQAGLAGVHSQRSSETGEVHGQATSAPNSKAVYDAAIGVAGRGNVLGGRRKTAAGDISTFLPRPANSWAGNGPAINGAGHKGAGAGPSPALLAAMAAAGSAASTDDGHSLNAKPLPPLQAPLNERLALAKLKGRMRKSEASGQDADISSAGTAAQSAVTTIPAGPVAEGCEFSSSGGSSEGMSRVGSLDDSCCDGRRGLHLSLRCSTSSHQPVAPHSSVTFCLQNSQGQTAAHSHVDDGQAVLSALWQRQAVSSQMQQALQGSDGGGSSSIPALPSLVHGRRVSLSIARAPSAG